MDKRTPNKRKSLANTATTPNKLQKFGSPAHQKKPQTPKSANKNQKTPQKKHINGKQFPKKEPEESEDDDEESDESIEQEVAELNQSDDSEAGSEEEDNDEDEDDEDDDDDAEDDDTEDKPAKTAVPEDRKFSAFIKGLNYDTTEEELKEYFNEDDKVASVFILKNPINNRSRGAAFVNFKTMAALKKSLEKNNTEIQGRTIKVSIANKRSDKPKTHLEKKIATLNFLKAKVRGLEKYIKTQQEKEGKGEKVQTKGKPFKKFKKAAT